MRLSFLSSIAVLGVALCPILPAQTPPLLARAMEQWLEGHGDLALTQQTRVFHDDGRLKTERTERYDPSLPDNQRWKLIEVDGKPPTEEQRKKWEVRKNSKPRKKPLKPLGEYVDLEHAKRVSETPTAEKFELVLRPEVARLIAVDKIAAYITVDKESKSITHIVASLKEPIRVALGLAKVTDLDLDVSIEPANETAADKSGEVQDGSKARVLMSRFGDPMEFLWSDFKRVPSYNTTKGADVTQK